MPRISIATTLAVLFASSLPAAEDREPPLEVNVEIDGQAAEVEVGGTAEITIDGKRRSVKLTAKPTRRFAKAGIEFRYPTSFNYEFDPDGGAPGAVTYTLTGNDTTLMVFVYPKAVFRSSEAAAGSVVEQLREAYEGERVAPAELRIGERVVKGSGVRVDVTGTAMTQEVFPVEGDAGSAVVLIVQTVPNEDGAEPAETKQVRKLIAGSFRSAKEPTRKAQ